MEGRRAHITRMLGAFRARGHIRNFYEQWLELRDVPQFNYSAPFLEDVKALSVRQQMTEEIRAFVDNVTWELNGNIERLLTDNASFATKSELAGVYGIPSSSATVPSNRSGLITRVAMLANGGDRTNPFLRGVRVLNKFLCKTPPRPDPTLLPEGALSPPVDDPSLPTRTRFENKTSLPQCASCHNTINPIGFALEAYDSIGRFRTHEKVLSSTGTVLQTHWIDTQVRLSLNGKSYELNGPGELSHALADSGAADECFVRQWFRYSHGRMESAGDACSLTELHDGLTQEGGSIRGMIEQTVLTPHFILGRVPQ